jgi:N-methylhydantoinase A
VLTQIQHLDADQLGRVFSALEDEALAILEEEQTPEDRRRIERSVDVRYYGQTPYLNLTLDEVPTTAEAIARIGERYADQYEREFGYRFEADVAAVEIVNARAAAIGLATAAEIVRRPAAEPEAAASESRQVYFEEVGEFVETPIYARSTLGPDAAFDGPAIVEQMDSTILIPPKSRARVDSKLNLIIDVQAPVDEAAAFAAAGPIDRGA